MKVVISINSATAAEDPWRLKFIEAVADLFEDGHHLVVIGGISAHDQRPSPRLTTKAWGNGARNGGRNNAECPACVPPADLELVNKFLAAGLSNAGVFSMALWGSDAAICRLRKAVQGQLSPGYEFETSSIDVRWLNMMCGNGVVPVLTNVGLSASGERCLTDPEQMASLCAIRWGADALIYLVSGEGVMDTAGTVIRWLNVERTHQLVQDTSENHNILAVLKSCKNALKSGVPRVRILPLSKVDCLSMFYSSRIDFGTEVIMAHEDEVPETAHHDRSH